MFLKQKKVDKAKTLSTLNVIYINQRWIDYNSFNCCNNSAAAF